ncbi:MAG: DUF1573 domain-containing protein [Candidatus Cryptobacteroides sp.]
MASSRSLITAMASICLIFAGSIVSAQIRTIPQEKLDSVLSPSLSPDATCLKFELKQIEIVMNEDDPPAHLQFAYVNIGHKAVTITHIATSCDCVKAIPVPRTVQPGDTAVIEVVYKPFGHVGKFDRKLMVYTSASSTRPAAMLDIIAEVSRGRDLSSVYPVCYGNMRLRRCEVRFSKGDVSEECIPVVNTGDKPLRVVAENVSAAGWLSFRSEPEVIEPGGEAELVVKYTPKDNERSVFPLMLNNLGIAPSRASIKIVLE